MDPFETNLHLKILFKDPLFFIPYFPIAFLLFAAQKRTIN